MDSKKEGQGLEVKVTHEELVSRYKNNYYGWIAKVCELLGKPVEYGQELVEDPNWFGCWDDRMTPEDAVKEARSKAIVK